MKTLEAGDFGLTKVSGPAGALIRFGQYLYGNSSEFEHAFLILDNQEVLEAEPGGAIITPLSNYIDRTDTVFIKVPLTDEQRVKANLAGRGLKGTPYSFLDYLALAMLHFHIRPKWLKDYVASDGHMICSQLVDEVELLVGYHMFDDGRAPQEVTPGGLADWAIRQGSK